MCALSLCLPSRCSVFCRGLSQVVSADMLLARNEMTLRAAAMSCTHGRSDEQCCVMPPACLLPRSGSTQGTHVGTPNNKLLNVSSDILRGLHRHCNTPTIDPTAGTPRALDAQQAGVATSSGAVGQGQDKAGPDDCRLESRRGRHAILAEIREREGAGRVQGGSSDLKFVKSLPHAHLVSLVYHDTACNVESGPLCH